MIVDGLQALVISYKDEPGPPPPHYDTDNLTYSQAVANNNRPHDDPPPNQWQVLAQSSSDVWDQEWEQYEWPQDYPQHDNYSWYDPDWSYDDSYHEPDEENIMVTQDQPEEPEITDSEYDMPTQPDHTYGENGWTGW